MNIRQRLSCLIGVALFGVVTTTAVGLWAFGSVKTSLEHTYEQDIPTLTAMSRLEQDFLEARGQLQVLVAEQDEDVRAGFAGHAGKLLKDMAATNSRLAGLTRGTAEAEGLDALVKQYAAKAGQVLALAGEGKLDEAQLALYAQLVPAERQLSDKLAALEDAQAKDQQALAQALTERARFIQAALIGGGALALLLVAGLGFLLNRSIMGPLTRLQQGMSRVTEQLDFTQRVEATGNDEVALTVGAFNRLLERVQQNMQQVAASVQVLGNAVGTLKRTAGHFQSVTEQSGMATASVAEAIDQVTGSIGQVAEYAQHAEKMAGAAGQSAADGGDTIGATVQMINDVAAMVHHTSTEVARLQQQTQSISTVVQVIRDVADQTNLLALNAAIEAARAGESGRGFAVVADEVRKLAERTSQSTNEISKLTSSIQAGVESAVDSMQQRVSKVEAGSSQAGQVIGVIGQIRDGARDVSQEVTGIAQAIGEQSTAVDQISRDLRSLNAKMGETTQTVEDATNSSAELDALATQLRQIVSQYKL